MSSLEDILLKVTLTDSDQIKEGTAQLREEFKKPDIVPSLCKIMGTSPNPTIRQYCAVLLRKRFSKKRNWSQLTKQIRKGIKEGIIQALINESETSIKKSIALLIGTIVKHLSEVDKQWPALIQFLNKTIYSKVSAEQELGISTLCSIADISFEAFVQHFPSICPFFKYIFDTNQPTAQAVFQNVICMKHFIPALKFHRQSEKLYAGLIPKVLNSISQFACVNEDQTSEMIELLEELLEESPNVVSNYIRQIVELGLSIALNKSFGPMLRCKAIYLTVIVIRAKKKTFLKLNLLKDTVGALFQLMCTMDLSGIEEIDSLAPEDSSPGEMAAQALHALALYLPADKLMPILAGFVEPSITDTDFNKRSAAFMALSAVTKGCCTYIHNNCLEQFILCVAKGITDNVPLVRNSALYALCQFGDHLQPEINCYAAQILPTLHFYLEQLYIGLSNGEKEPKGIERTFYALENFIEKLEKDDISQYLPILMEKLLLLLNNPNISIRVRELTLNCVGHFAEAAKDDFLPYFSTVIEILKSYLMNPTKENITMQVQALDTLGMLAKGLKDQFKPLAHESIKLSIQLIQAYPEEIDIRKASYGVFGSVSSILKEEMEGEIFEIMPLIIHSLQSKDDFVIHRKEDAESAYPVFNEVSVFDEEDIADENSDSEEANESDDILDVEGCTLQNTYVEEKEEALMALQEIAANLGSKFVPFIKEIYSIVYGLLIYPNDEVKSEALNALEKMCTSWGKDKSITAQAELKEALLLLIPKLAELIKCETEFNVVITCMQVITNLLKELKGLVIEGEGHCEAIVNAIKNVLLCKTQCQLMGENEQENENGDNEYDEIESGDEAEQDELLLEYTSDVVRPLGFAMSNDKFYLIFKDLFPLIVNKTKPQCSEAQRAFSSGLLAECIPPLGETQIPNVINELLPFLLKLSTDNDNDIRNNSIYALGELAVHGKSCVLPHYPAILLALSAALSREDNGPYLLDNICAAICRLIMTNPTAVPLDQVLPVLFKNLPLRADEDEIKTVFDCINMLYKAGNTNIIHYISQIILFAADSLKPNKVNDELCSEFCVLLKSIEQDFPEKFKEGVVELKSPNDAYLKKYFTY